jgi:hypothetical protein
MPVPRVSSLQFFTRLNWIDGTPLVDRIDPYRRRLFAEALDMYDADGRPRYNLILCGRAKKNWKSADLVLAALFALCANDSPGGNQCYLLANDEDQAGDDLGLAKKLIAASPVLAAHLTIRQKTIERNDGRGFLMVLPAGDVAGSHGKTARFIGWDEIHGYKAWDILEALQPDPTRLDAIQWITSYASLFHRPGVPLYDLMATGRAGTDPRMLFSWYAADYCTDPEFRECDPETRANPSRTSWADADYLAQQQRRLPAHKYRRLHLNLPGLPEGSAFAAETVMDAVARGCVRRQPEDGIAYVAFVDMSGGSHDDAVLAIAHCDADGRAVLDCVVNQGPPPPFDPRRAVEKFVTVLREYRVYTVVGDAYAGETFRADFERHGIGYERAGVNKTKLYEALEPILNGHGAVLLDSPLVEQQLLGLVWRGGRIDHQPGEHDDWANAAAGALVCAASPVYDALEPSEEELASLHAFSRHPDQIWVPSDEVGGNVYGL